MDLHLQGKSALVTGSTKGIGFAIASALAREGASVIVNGRGDKAVEEAIEAIRKGCAADGVKAEVEGVAANGGTAAGVARIIEAAPSVDILVNNLGIYEPKEFAEIDDTEWLRVFEINVMSGIRLSRHYLPGLLARNWGRIIFISSESGVNIPAEMIHYGFSKTAQIAVARGLAELTAGSAVTVNSVLVGPTRSEGVSEFVASIAKQRNISPQVVEDEIFQTLRPSSLIKRFATTTEIANMVVFLCSEVSSATNGAAVRADGGCIKSIL